jgi:hypothetical protein
MSNLRLKKITSTIFVIVFILTAMIQCTKDGVNSTQIQRSIGEIDTTVFTSFYDSIAIEKRDNPIGFNDVIRTTGVQSILRTNCGSVACHGGTFKPNITNYAEIKALVVPGNPEGSKLYQLITTNDVVSAMPPVNYGIDLSATEKTKIYNWIKNGANEAPTLLDYRPAAISMLTNGCASANCHNQATLGGDWARKKLITVATTDTVNFTYTEPGGRYRNYSQLKEPRLSEVWNAYKDSVRKFYADTVANLSFKPKKTITVRSPMNTLDDIMLDIWYPKGSRAKATYWDNTNSFFYQLDSTIRMKNPHTNAMAVEVGGDMAWEDGGLTRNEVALFKAWYFADPNIPDLWKYGKDGLGIFKYKKTGNFIKKN